MKLIKEYNSNESLERGQKISVGSGDNLDSVLEVFGNGGELVSYGSVTLIMMLYYFTVLEILVYCYQSFL